MIYFIHDKASGLVKIGFSKSPWLRVSKIQSDSPNPLTLEAVIDGDLSDEAELHRRFADQRVRGEWFTWDGPVALHVGTVEAVSAPQKRDSVQTEVTRALVGAGYHHSYASRLCRGLFPWPLPIALLTWRLTGHKYGPIANAPDEHIDVLTQYVEVG